MRIALPTWQHRISPVFDVARCLRIVDIEHGAITGETEHGLDDDHQAILVLLGVHMVICGAISRELKSRLRSEGIEVIAGICGLVDEITTAFLDGRLYDPRFASPGCCNHRQRRRTGNRGERTAEKYHPLRR